ncbi:MAG: Hpt domain-containing protein [Ruminococcaceae bacterium]|nr:Hpt domain-containing protein [Oscillospiraceae bacterium]
MQFLESLKEYGCNIDAGLDRMKGKVDFYKRLLFKFPEVIEENEFRSLIESNEIDRAIERTHLIKGVTANLSIDSLYNSYTKIVNFLRQGNPQAALEEFDKIENLQKELVEFIKNNAG